MIRVRTPSRLHFGLVSFTFDEYWSNLLGEHVLPARRFGGVGLMVQEPGVQLTVERAPRWSAHGPLAERAVHFAQLFRESYPPGIIRPHQIVIEKAPIEHAGLGTGTQLGLAIGQALARAHEIRGVDAVALARRAGRGVRSALGIHGFAAGGFLVEAGKRSSTDVSPLIARVEFPDTWRVLLVIPSGAAGIHGEKETAAFASLSKKAMPTVTEILCRLVLLGLLPALREQDFLAFSEYLFDFNVRVGETFGSVQGGRYGHPRTAAIISFLRKKGIRGVGQSSWGPTVFALAPDEAEAMKWAGRLKEEFSLDCDEVLITRACNVGAVIVEEQ
jgi:beta-ribofuranosylaminobenzene 5'-phosphate synthase